MGTNNPNDSLEVLPIQSDSPNSRGKRNGDDAATTKRQRRAAQIGAAVVAVITAVVLLTRLFGWVFADQPAAPPLTPDSSSGEVVGGASTLDFTIQPIVNLFDRERIQIVVHGFAPDNTIAARMCVSDLAMTDAPLPNRCDTGTYVVLEQANDGSIETTYAVARSLIVGGRMIDCAVRGCEVQVLALQELDRTIATGLQFDKDKTAFVPPRISITPSEDIRGDQIITITGSTLAASTRVAAGLCVDEIPENALNCRQPTATQSGLTDYSGNLEMQFTVPRFVFVHSEWLDCANLVVGTCVIVVDDGITERVANTVAVKFRPVALGLEDLGNLELSATPSTGLVEGSFVTIKSRASYFQDGDPIVEICPASDPIACTNLPLQSVFSDGNAVWFSVIVRRFLASSDAKPYDCAADSACVLEIQLTTGDGEVAELPIEFGDNNESAHRIGLDPGRPQPAGTALTVSIISVERDFELSICVVGAADMCDLRPLNALTTALLGTTRFEFVLGGALITADGDVNCVRDVECEIVLIDPGTKAAVGAVPVSFDPSSPVLRTFAAVRPRLNLNDGELARLRLENAFNHPYEAVLCVSGTEVCATVATFERPGRRAVAYVALPRFVFGRTGSIRPTQTFDCAITECELRFRSGTATIAALVSFSTEQPRPAPELALDVSRPLIVGENVSVRVRYLDPLSDQQQQSVLVLCNNRDDDPYGDSCLLLERAVQSTSDTTAEATFVVPSVSERELPDDERVCLSSCTLMFATAPGRRPATLAVDFAR